MPVVRQEMSDVHVTNSFRTCLHQLDFEVNGFFLKPYLRHTEQEGAVCESCEYQRLVHITFPRGLS